MGDGEYRIPPRAPFESTRAELPFGKGTYVDTAVTTGDDDRIVFKFEIVTLQIV